MVVMLKYFYFAMPEAPKSAVRTVAGGERRQLSCFFDGTKGVGIVPSAGVEQLPIVDGTNVTGTLIISTDVQRDAVEDDWRIFVVASTVHARRAILTSTP